MGSTSDRHVDARAAPERLALERPARAQVGGHVGDVDPEPDPLALAAGGHRVVEVLGVVGVDREGGQLGQVHAGVARVWLGERVLRLAAGGAGVVAVEAAIRA